VDGTGGAACERLDAPTRPTVTRQSGVGCRLLHFRTANEDGLSAGIAIGEWTVAHHLQPKVNRSCRWNGIGRRFGPVTDWLLNR
jgi:hypothetical protein